jgi:gamma-glutamyl hercynylcysteine S-oxide synthase
MRSNGLQSPVLNPNAHRFRNADDAELDAALRQARSALENVFLVYERELIEKNFSVPEMPIANLPLWELGHVAWFQERWLARNSERNLGVRCNPHAPLAKSMLEGADAFYDSSAVSHSSRWQLSLPNLQVTKAYADSVFDQSLALLEETEPHSDSHYLFWLSAAHEYMHVEAFSYMANTLGLVGSESFRKERLTQTTCIQGVQGFLIQPNRFWFDNESELQMSQAMLEDSHALDLDRQPVSWEMLNEFRASRQYSDDKYWQGQGHELGKSQIWARAKPLDADDPTSAASHVSYWEAKAWCLWRGRALPTEAQWLATVAADNLAWGQVWEWTCSEFSPYPGFAPHPYEDYSNPWFDKGFKVLKGGSIYTHERMKHPLYRNFFLPARDDVCTGFRSCKSLLNRLD